MKQLLALIGLFGFLWNAAAECALQIDADHPPVKNIAVERADSNGKTVFLFDGKSSYMESPTRKAPPSFTFTAWVKPEAAPSGQGAILCKQGFHTSLSYSEWKCFWFSTYTADKKLVQMKAPEYSKPGVWYFVAGSYDDTTKTLALHINDARVNEKVLNQPLLENSGKYVIGAMNPAVPAKASWYQGEIGQIRVFDSALGEEELSKLYAAEKDQWK